jgi:copper chaperone CopZ
MRVEVLFFEGCPNHKPAVELARDVARELGVSAEVEEVEVKSQEDVTRLRFLGSPSIHVNGVDVEPQARGRTDFGFTCRTYGGKGLPKREFVEAALRSPPQAPSGHGDSAPAGTTGTADTRGAEPPGTLWATAGSVVSAVAASACCWLPLLLVAFGVSAAGVSAAFETFRPVFLVAAALLLGFAFYRTYFRQEVCAPGSACAVPRKGQRLNRVMVWVATGFVLVFALFPKYIGHLLADNGSQANVSAEGATVVTLDLDGMSCEACAPTVEKALRSVPGVTSASVSYTESRAKVTIDPSSPPSREALVAAVEKAGYEVKDGPGAK